MFPSQKMGKMKIMEKSFNLLTNFNLLMIKKHVAAGLVFYYHGTCNTISHRSLFFRKQQEVQGN